MAAIAASGNEALADDWPRWRGPGGRGVAAGDRLPLRWSSDANVLWSTPVPGEGTSSPIISGSRIYLTSAEREGERRAVHCFARADGEPLWTRSIEDDAPELTSSVTGHAAPTPATDGRRVVAFFGNAGLVCFDSEGALQWRTSLGEFETELGLASSPVIHGDRVLLVCDHDGDRFSSFDSFLIALDISTGDTIWRTERRGLYRSWSTPILVPAGDEEELVVCAQDEIRGYDSRHGRLLWRIRGLTGWVVPSPVYAGGRIFATSGKNGPVIAARPGGRGDVTSTHIVWKRPREGAYVTSPVVYDGRLWVVRRNGVLSCYRAGDGERLYRARLDGRFTASPVAGAGHVYFTAERGTTHVVRAADSFDLVASNDLGEYTAASPAAAGGRLFLRTDHRLYCIAESDEEAASRAAIERGVAFLAEAAAEWPEENGCFSCHNNGDAARALFAARSASFDVSADAWRPTLEWLRSPEGWAKQKGGGDYSDPDLAPLQFAAALEAATRAGCADDAEATARAVDLLAERQREDGSWSGGSRNPVGSPTAWSRHLATWRARCFLASSAPRAHREAIRRADKWLEEKTPRNVHDAAIGLLRGLEADGPRFRRSLELLRAGRAPSGGWGPFTHSAPEVFDTALVLLALARLDRDSRDDEIAEWKRAARRFLVSAQEPGGAWPETTRPPGAESYAQRVSTTAWAVLALLETR